MSLLHAALALWFACSSASTLTLEGPLVRAVLVVDDPTPGVPASGRTYFSELAAKAPGGTPTANLLFNYSQPGHDASWSAARLSSTAVSSLAPPAPVFCGSVGGASPPVRNLTLRCLAPAATLHISFAAYGTPTGGCTAPAQGACATPGALATAAAACEGRAACTLSQGAPTFPGDPCPDVPKSLVVVAACSSGAGTTDPPWLQWAGAAGGTLAAVTATHAAVTGVAVGPLVVEDWEVDVAEGLSWAVTRRYTADARLLCERGPFFAFNTQYNLSAPWGSQIPSLLDPGTQLNATDGLGFYCPLGDNQDNEWRLTASSPTPTFKVCDCPRVGW